jgi:hypothetical protein
VHRFARSNGFVTLYGMDVQLVQDRAYDINDPVVKEFPHLFSDNPTVYDRNGLIVETATAAPGEKRAVRRG